MVTIIVIAFLLGYAAISLENKININKTAIALLTGVICWTIYILFSSDFNIVLVQLEKHLSGIAAIIFFLLGAMTIVELIDLHNGFDFISEKIQTRSKKKLLWVVGIFAFFLSAVLDNLTTTIVMITLTRKLIHNPKDRLWFASVIIIAANAGGVWSPIGDVTTTMLWIGNQISTVNIIKTLFFPGLLSAIIPILLISRYVKGVLPIEKTDICLHTSWQRSLPFFIGIGLLLFVPVFKVLTNLPPYMGMFLVLGLVWLLTEIIDYTKDERDKHTRSVAYALRKIDITSVLFFAGILLCVAALDATGILGTFAQVLIEKIKNENIIAFLIGLSSSVFDNVPLVAATMSMFPLYQYPTDHTFWEFIAYCSGTGGSMLVIGSAAGVAAMGMEKIDFFWYLKRISWIALLGYIAGALVYLVEITFFF